MSSKYRVICKHEPHSVISEQYRKLRTSIDYSSFNKELKVINVTSTFPQEGKTFTVLNLAQVYAQTHQKVLIVDLDLRKPKINRSYGLSNTGGVSDFVKNEHSVHKNIKKVEENLDVLVAGEKVPFPAEVLVSYKVKEMFKELREEYDIILVDSPPLSAVADATIISNLCDGTLFVCASRKTNKDFAKDVVKKLKESGANIIGGVLSQVQKKDAFYGVDYYYYYGDK